MTALHAYPVQSAREAMAKREALKAIAYTPPEHARNDAALEADMAALAKREEAIASASVTPDLAALIEAANGADAALDGQPWASDEPDYDPALMEAYHAKISAVRQYPARSVADVLAKMACLGPLDDDCAEDSVETFNAIEADLTRIAALVAPFDPAAFVADLLAADTTVGAKPDGGLTEPLYNGDKPHHANADAMRDGLNALTSSDRDALAAYIAGLGE